MTAALPSTSGSKPTRKSRSLQSRASGFVARRASLPEYLEMADVEALIQLAPHANARFLFLVQWRAGLRVSEALALEVADLELGGDNSTLRVREGIGGEVQARSITRLGISKFTILMSKDDGSTWEKVSLEPRDGSRRYSNS